MLADVLTTGWWATPYETGMVTEEEIETRFDVVVARIESKLDHLFKGIDLVKRHVDAEILRLEERINDVQRRARNHVVYK